MSDVSTLIAALAVVCAAVFVIVYAYAYFMWTLERNRIGPVCCKRCGYKGLVGQVLVPNRGLQSVCPTCKSADWVAESVTK